MKRWQAITAVGVLAAFISGLALGPIIFGQGSPTASSNPAASPTLTRAGETGVIKVVASTAVWANIIELVGGEWVEVTAIIDLGTQDPRAYEANPQDQIAVNEADLVVYNGGGYDDFMLGLFRTADEAKLVLPMIDSDEYLETSPGGEKNVHIWYDLGSVEASAERIADVITELRPEAFTQINTNFDFFVRELGNLEIRVEALREKALGLGVITTEEVANLMLEDAGFINMTPPALAEAVREKLDVPASAASEATALIKGQVVILLVTNPQASNLISQELTGAAVVAGASIVGLSAMMPQGLDYLDWMAQVIDQLQEAIY